MVVLCVLIRCCCLLSCVVACWRLIVCVVVFVVRCHDVVTVVVVYCGRRLWFGVGVVALVVVGCC